MSCSGEEQLWSAVEYDEKMRNEEEGRTMEESKSDRPAVETQGRRIGRGLTSLVMPPIKKIAAFPSLCEVLKFFYENPKYILANTFY